MYIGGVSRFNQSLFFVRTFLWYTVRVDYEYVKDNLKNYKILNDLYVIST